ncbi:MULTISPECIES: virulence factor TspB C-terminal domain-related protein [unclassified Rhodanobacter]|uniref:Virulence factor TspB C-terminal domain-related protein n=1 Tax=Rhodanobacter humi TaxID=1888173 RepID=A0ABV4AXH6_9GAMM
MATFLARRSLGFLLVVLFVGVSALVSSPKARASAYGTYQQAMANCQANVAINPSMYCSNLGQVSGGRCDVVLKYGSAIQNDYFYDCSTYQDPGCSSVADGSGTAFANNRTAANAVQICSSLDYKGSTQGVGCVETFSAGTGIENAAGGMVFSGTFHASGGSCTPNADGSFTPYGASSPSPVPPTTASHGQPSPKVCGGGSCVDPGTGQACIVDQSGTQFCTPAQAAFPTAPTIPTPQPNCYSDGSSATLCVGMPKAPIPTNPPTSVTDPATQISGTDTYNVSTSGGQTTTTVNVYNTAGGTTSNGQKSGDLGTSSGATQNGTNPAHSSSAGGNGTYSGGTDCNTPPVCTGDAVLCGASRAQWATTCQVHTDLAGTLPAPSATSLATGGSYDQGSVWTTPSTGNTVGDQANAGNYDQSGFGYGTQCPFVDTHVTFMSSSFSLPWSEACDATSYLRWVVIGFALYLGACITAGSNR